MINNPDYQLAIAMCRQVDGMKAAHISWFIKAILFRKQKEDIWELLFEDRFIKE